MRCDDARMTFGPIRLLLAVAAAAALALPAIGTAAATDVTTDRGIVESVGVGQIVLRSLDGSVEAFAIGPATRVKVNGVPASIADVKRGFVATVAHDGSAPALAVRAFGREDTVTDRGIVTALTREAITLRTPIGVEVTIPLDGATRFRFRGFPAPRFLARQGAVVSVKHLPGGTARVVDVIKRARA